MSARQLYPTSAPAPQTRAERVRQLQAELLTHLREAERRWTGRRGDLILLSHSIHSLRHQIHDLDPHALLYWAWSPAGAREIFTRSLRTPERRKAA